MPQRSFTALFPAPIVGSVVMLAALVIPFAALAQSFDVTLGGRVLGTVTYGKGVMSTTLDNTPLGVFNGGYQGRVQIDAATSARRYTGVSTSSRKGRTISTLGKDGKVIETTITPASEKTALSDPAKVPEGVIDPVAALGRFVTAKGCPGRFRIYDGRRVITVSPQSQSQRDGVLSCQMKYRVTAGPGHLSPLKISKIALSLTYDVAGKEQSLQAMRLKGGLFEVSLTR